MSRPANLSSSTPMIGGAPDYIIRTARRVFRAADQAVADSLQKPKITAAKKPPAAARLVLKSNLKEAMASRVSLATPIRSFQPAASPTNRGRLNTAQRLAIASAVHTAMERLFSCDSPSAKASAINDMLQEIEGAL